ncbi:hypothetical protein GCM10025868_25320 [Angustibacter aerolatus]|uniref:Molecular chaperone DnaK n=1 Tax=Angustibacter aerolatus TaxID=1162965 RepID=A0ABQ6JGD1_9ACTN|nr:hypothetical protein GCM10025868_25320 [Angustibacter aerolatus]
MSAKDRGTGVEQAMTISGGSALPKDEIERMIKDAEAHAEEDKQRREEAETRNQAEQAGVLHREVPQGQRREGAGRHQDRGRGRHRRRAHVAVAERLGRRA